MSLYSVANHEQLTIAYKGESGRLSDPIVRQGEFQFLKVEPTGVPGVWNVALPSLPWQQSKAEEERTSLVRSLLGRLPIAALWVSDWVTTNSAGWDSPVEQGSLPRLLGDLYEGGWALMFFGSELPGVLPEVKGIPDDSREAASLLRSVGAGAAIFSWYDDREWTVVVLEDAPDGQDE